jgi:hypothetical protein
MGVAATRLDHVRAIQAIVNDDVYGGLLDVTHDIPPRAAAQVREN